MEDASVTSFAHRCQARAQGGCVNLLAEILGQNRRFGRQDCSQRLSRLIALTYSRVSLLGDHGQAADFAAGVRCP